RLQNCQGGPHGGLSGSSPMEGGTKLRDDDDDDDDDDSDLDAVGLGDSPHTSPSSPLSPASSPPSSAGLEPKY
ncbi:hypothetical protein LSAT2_029255, partial [Lamellibrachia satsuma]